MLRIRVARGQYTPPLQEAPVQVQSPGFCLYSCSRHLAECKTGAPGISPSLFHKKSLRCPSISLATWTFWDSPPPVHFIRPEFACITAPGTSQSAKWELPASLLRCSRRIPSWKPVTNSTPVRSPALPAVTFWLDLTYICRGLMPYRLLIQAAWAGERGPTAIRGDLRPAATAELAGGGGGGGRGGVGVLQWQ